MNSAKRKARISSSYILQGEKGALLHFLLIIAISPLILGQTMSKKADDTDQQKQVLLKLTDELTATKAKRDVAVLDRMLVDEFIFINPAGLFADKAEYLEGARIDTAVYESVKNYEQVVKVYGDAAVVAGSTTVKGRCEGQEIGGRFRFTNTYVKRQDKWPCIAIHLTRIAQQWKACLEDSSNSADEFLIIPSVLCFRPLT